MSPKSLKKPNVAVVFFPWKSYSPYKFLSDLLSILEPISSNLLLIGGNTDRIQTMNKKIKVRDIGIGMHYLKDINPKIYSAGLWIIKCIFIQINLSFEIIKSRKDIDEIIFYMIYPYYLFPLIISKFLGIRTVEVVTRSRSDSFISRMISFQDSILYSLLDGISLESKSLIKHSVFENYGYKLLPEGARFIQTSVYKPLKKMDKRTNLVGYVGRISEEKGVLEFIKSIPLITNKMKDITFLIGGSGDLLEIVRHKCELIELNCNTKIYVTGFIQENDFPAYLNDLKLLVLPTQHAEGLPTIILEAMACGTPVLATVIGGISDVIIDGKTGFIMQNNSPKCISENIIRALNCPNLEEITVNARNFVENKYSYSSAIERYRDIINFEFNPQIIKTDNNQ